MKRYKLAILLLAGVISACEVSNESQQTNVLPSSPVDSRIEWPPPSNDTQSVVVARDLLATDYEVVLDSSGSMDGRACGSKVSKSEAAKQALKVFATRVPAGANLGLIVFDSDGITERVALGTGSANRTAFMDAVMRTKPGGGTPLWHAITLAKEKIEAQGRSQLGYGQYHIVVVTDGEADITSNPASVVNEINTRSPIIIHTVGFCIGEDHSLNQPGRIFYREAASPEQLQEGLTEVLAESPTFDVLKFED